MRPPRFSLAALSGAVMFCGVGLAALRWPSALAANAIFSLALGSLVIALVAVVNCRGPNRAYWSGFALGGWVYLTVALGPFFDHTHTTHLLTTALLHLVEEHVVAPPAQAPAPSSMPGGSMMGMPAGNVMGGSVGVPGLGLPAQPPTLTRWDLWTAPDGTIASRQVGSFFLDSPESYLRIGHSLFCLFIAWACGLIGRHFWASNPREAGSDGLASARPGGEPLSGTSH